MKSVPGSKVVSTFILFFLLVGGIQLVQGLCGLPYYDIPYLLLITLILVIGDFFRQVRWLAFACAFFLLDLTPSFVLLPIGLFLFAWRGFHFTSPQNVSLERDSKFLIIKMGF